MQNMLKYISQVYENHSNNLIKFIIHLLISSGGDVLFSLGDKKHKKLIFLRGLSVITLALGAVIIKSYLSLESFVNLEKENIKGQPIWQMTYPASAP